MIYFIHLPRTGGTFLSQYTRNKQTRLRKQFNYWPNEYAAKKHVPANTIPNYKDHFLFGLIRNPFDWYVSQYSYFIDKDIKGIKEIEDTIAINTDAGLIGKEFQKRFPNFNQWIEFGLTCTPNFWLSNLHDYMFCENGKMIMNYVGKFENMSDELEYVLKLNSLKSRVPLKDFWGYRNESRRKDYHEYFNEKSIRIITEKDRNILNLYGYTY